MKTINFLLPIFIFTFGFSHAQQTQESNSTLDSSSETSIVLDSVPETYNIKRFSLGLKAGVPNIVSVGAQYTLPFLNNHLAPYFEYSSYSFEYQYEYCQKNKNEQHKPLISPNQK